MRGRACLSRTLKDTYGFTPGHVREFVQARLHE